MIRRRNRNKCGESGNEIGKRLLYGLDSFCFANAARIKRQPQSLQIHKLLEEKAMMLTLLMKIDTSNLGHLLHLLLIHLGIQREAAIPVELVHFAHIAARHQRLHGAQQRKDR